MSIIEKIWDRIDHLDMDLWNDTSDYAAGYTDILDDINFWLSDLAHSGMSESKQIATTKQYLRDLKKEISKYSVITSEYDDGVHDAYVAAIETFEYYLK